MKYRHRMSGSILLSTRERANYHSHLRAIGFRPNDRLYRFFGNDVFHDGVTSSINFEDGMKDLKMRLRNVYALDNAHSLRVKNEARLIRSIDFDTEVVFKDISRFNASRDTNIIKDLRYNLSYLERRANEILLNIEFTDDGGCRLCLAIQCRQIDIMDISMYVKKYFPGIRNIGSQLYPKNQASQAVS